jgi:4-amino-4-deoxychorismate lyase
MIAALVNGALVNHTSKSVDLKERGLSYGDGLFETMLLSQGAVQLVDLHMARLQLGCERLGITCSEQLIRDDIAKLCFDRDSGVIKVIVTRGAGGRGYRSTGLTATRIALLYAQPSEAARDLKVRWCQTRLARNAQLAGLKHLNRLEQVLAQNEWHDTSIGEGLMLDTEGELICATSSNLFAVIDDILVTPDLRYSGVRGVMRAHVITVAQRLGIVVEERALRPDEFAHATEVFLTNAVRGIRPVVQLDEQCWPVGPVTNQLLATRRL